MSQTQFVNYKQASDWAKSNNLRTSLEYKIHIEKERCTHVPKNPNRIYQDHWQGWSKFLQNGRRRKTLITATYEECQKWAQNNSIQTAKQWYQLKDRLPSSMPSVPEVYFKDKWKGWPEFLGTNRFSGVSIIERVIRMVLDDVLDPKEDDHRKQSVVGYSGTKHMVDMCYPKIKLIVEYDGQFYHLEKEANDLAKTQDLQKSSWSVVRIREGRLKIIDKEWNVAVKKYKHEDEKVKDILKHIQRLSISGKISLKLSQEEKLSDLINNLDLFPYFQKMGDYNEFVSYEECQTWVLKHQIKSEAHWRTFKHLMEKDKIPYHPERTYRNRGWVNWPTFLKNGQRSKKENWATYEEASRWAQENCIKGAKQWYRLGDDRPINMPSAPEITYKDEWTNWPEFLKNGKTPNNSFVSYEEASKWAQDNNIKTGAQWFALRERPDNLPTYPSNVYKKD